MERSSQIEANRLYKRACYHDKHHPDEPSQVSLLPKSVIEGHRAYARDRQRCQRAAASEGPVIKLRPLDGIVDDEAINRAVRGLPAILTVIEASAAIVRMHALNIPRHIIAARFGMTIAEASKLCPCHGGWGKV